MNALNYEELVCEFNNKLLSQLRSHAPSVDFLEMWVPDEDPCKSILNMAEAAQAYGRSDLLVRVNKSTVEAAQLKSLCEDATRIGAISVEDVGTGWLISVKNL